MMAKKNKLKRKLKVNYVSKTRKRFICLRVVLFST